MKAMRVCGRAQSVCLSCRDGGMHTLACSLSSTSCCSSRAPVESRASFSLLAQWHGWWSCILGKKCLDLSELVISGLVSFVWS